MHETLRGLDPDRLERSCTPRTNAIRLGAGAPGLERAEMRFASCRFSPHRHDTYAIGITTAGVQEFRYRGRRHICLPGQLHFLHPDETHDGGPATDAGFAYRILYVEPGARPRGARTDGRSRSSPSPSRTGRRRPVSCDACSTRWTTRSATSEGTRRPPRSRRPWLRWAAERSARGGSIWRRSRACASYIAAHASEPTPASTLERIAGIDRYAIARQFRRAYGTSPDRYRTMRRLRTGADGDRGGRAARAGRGRRRLRRPEPHDPPVRARLRAHAGAVGRDRCDLGSSLGRVILARGPPDSRPWRVLSA